MTEIFPVVGIVLMVILSAGNDAGRKPGPPPQNAKAYKAYKTKDFVKVVNPEADYEAILRFIEKKYRKILPEERERIARQLVEQGKTQGLDPKLAAALIARESAFDKEAISSTGAKGLGQIKDFNYKSLNIKNPFDIDQNVSGTVGYLKRMMGIWKDKSNQLNLALGSYFKGHGAVKKGKEKLDAKTQAYVNDILENYKSISDIKKTIEPLN